MPPFLLTGLALVDRQRAVVAAGAPVARSARRRSLLGVYGLFGFHFLLFVALRTRAAARGQPRQLPVAAAHRRARAGVPARACAAAGARRSRRSPASPARRWRSSAGAASSGGLAWGYLAAAGSAFIWASYSLLTRRVAHFPTAAIGLFGLVSGLLALACHALLEPAVALSARDWLLIALVGLGPLGAAFFLWDAALKRSDPRRDRPAQLPDAARLDAAAGG